MAKHLLPSQVLGKEGPLILKLLHSENDPRLSGSIYSSKPSTSVVTALYIDLESTLQVGKLRLRDRRWPGARGHGGGVTRGGETGGVSAQPKARPWSTWPGKERLSLSLPTWGGCGSTGKVSGKKDRFPLLMAGGLLR